MSPKPQCAAGARPHSSGPLLFFLGSRGLCFCLPSPLCSRSDCHLSPARQCTGFMCTTYPGCLSMSRWTRHTRAQRGRLCDGSDLRPCWLCTPGVPRLVRDGQPSVRLSSLGAFVQSPPALEHELRHCPQGGTVGGKCLGLICPWLSRQLQFLFVSKDLFNLFERVSYRERRLQEALHPLTHCSNGHNGQV